METAEPTMLEHFRIVKPNLEFEFLICIISQSHLNKNNLSFTQYHFLHSSECFLPLCAVFFFFFFGDNST